MLNYRYDTLLSQNEQLKKQIIVMDCVIKQKQKEVCLRLNLSLQIMIEAKYVYIIIKTNHCTRTLHIFNILDVFCVKLSFLYVCVKFMYFLILLTLKS